MIDIRKLKELVRLMVSNELTELDLRDSEEQVTLRRQQPAGTLMTQAVGSPPQPAGAAPQGAPQPPPDPAGSDTQDAGLHRIESPIVGTFYAAANPDSAPFVSAGSVVEPDTVVCIVEAMKLFNEIKAECSGTIERVLVKNGESIEFGQPIFLVNPQ